MKMIAIIAAVYAALLVWHPSERLECVRLADAMPLFGSCHD
jgi:hypothetical protein